MADHLRAGAEEARLLTLQEAADALKVHYMTAYRWVRRGTLPAFKAGGRLRVRSDDLEAFMRQRVVDTALPTARARRTNWSRHIERLHKLLLDGSAADAAALTRKVVADGAPVGDVYLRLVTPAMHRIGEDWAAGRITVAEEHRATAIAAGIVTRLEEHFRRRGPAKGTAITLTPAEELHGLAAQMVAAFLRRGGYDVHHLGPNVPAPDLQAFQRRVLADIVCISVTRGDLDDRVLSQLVDAAGRRDGTLTILGGQGADGAVAERVGAVHVEDLAVLTSAIDAHRAR